MHIDVCIYTYMKTVQCKYSAVTLVRNLKPLIICFLNWHPISALCLTENRLLRVKMWNSILYLGTCILFLFFRISLEQMYCMGTQERKHCETS